MKPGFALGVQGHQAKTTKGYVTGVSYSRTWLGQKSGKLFKKRDMDQIVYKTDTKTGAMEDVTTKIVEVGLGMIDVPMEIDLPSLVHISAQCPHIFARLGMTQAPMELCWLAVLQSR